MAKNYFCPICGKDLHKINNIDSVCLEQTCKIWGRPIPNVVSDYLRDMVGALIVSQTDLEIARKALCKIRYCKSAGFALPAQTPWEIIADKALEQIEHKE